MRTAQGLEIGLVLGPITDKVQKFRIGISYICVFGKSWPWWPIAVADRVIANFGLVPLRTWCPLTAALL